MMEIIALTKEADGVIAIKVEGVIWQTWTIEQAKYPGVIHFALMRAFDLFVRNNES